MSWHTYHRPQQVSDLQLADVRELLLRLMKSGNFPQVFLCAGPKGTGKTSTARLIGAVLNDPANEATVKAIFFEKKTHKNENKLVLAEPDPQSELAQAIFAGQSFVVQEMDAASNRGIDDIRALKERVQLPPQIGLMAVYILDEVHMLTNEAFNALLKLLEEPPAHAVFVLATTELHKVPATIQSRSTLLQYRKATDQELVAALQRVAKLESLELSAEVAQSIATAADGSFRDAIKSLELIAGVSASKKISAEDVELVLKSGFSEQIPDLIQAVLDKDESQVVQVIRDLRQRGVTSVVVLKSLVAFLHQDMTQALGLIPGDAKYSVRISHFILQELAKVVVVPSEPMALLSLELLLLELVFRAQGKTGSGKSAPSAAPSKKKVSAPTKAHAQAQVVATVPVTATNAHLDTKPLLAAWPDFVKLVEAKNSTLAAFLRSATPLVEQSNGIARVEVYYQFHHDQLIQPRFMEMLQSCAEPLLGGRPGFEFIVSARSEAALADEILV